MSDLQDTIAELPATEETSVPVDLNSHEVDPMLAMSMLPTSEAPSLEESVKSEDEYIKVEYPAELQHLVSHPVQYKDFITHDFVELSDLIKTGPFSLHRGNWEITQIYSALKNEGLLHHGVRGLAYVAEQCDLLSLIASRGVSLDIISDKNKRRPDLASEYDWRNVNMMTADEDVVEEPDYDFVISISWISRLSNFDKCNKFILSCCRKLKKNGFALHAFDYSKIDRYES